MEQGKLVVPLLFHQLPRFSRPTPDQLLWNRPTTSQLQPRNSSNNSSSRLSSRALLCSRLQLQAVFARPRFSSPPRPPFKKFSRVQSNSRLQWFNRTQLKSPLRSNRMQFRRAPPPCNHPPVSKNPHTAQ